MATEELIPSAGSRRVGLAGIQSCEAVGDQLAGHRVQLATAITPASIRPGSPALRVSALDWFSLTYGPSTIRGALTAVSARAEKDSLRLLGADPGHQDQAHTQRSDNRAEGVGRVDAADNASGIFFRRRHRGGRRARSGKLAPHRIAGGRIAHRQRAISSWKMNHGLECQQRIDGPVRQRIRDHVRCPGESDGEQSLAAAQRQPGPHSPRQPRSRPKLPIPMPIRKTARIIENT